MEPKQRREYQREWRAKNPQKLAAYESRRANKPERTAYQKLWRAKNADRYREKKQEWQRIYRAANREHVNALARERGRRRSGLLPTEVRARFEAQGLRCAICKTDRSHKWVSDHEHASGMTRGVLCNQCNLAIGLLKDNPTICHSAGAYLEHYANLGKIL